MCWRPPLDRLVVAAGAGAVQLLIGPASRQEAVHGRGILARPPDSARRSDGRLTVGPTIASPRRRTRRKTLNSAAQPVPRESIRSGSVEVDNDRGGCLPGERRRGWTMRLPRVVLKIGLTIVLGVTIVEVALASGTNDARFDRSSRLYHVRESSGSDPLLRLRYSRLTSATSRS